MAEAKKVPIIIRKKFVHTASHGGAWKVAYADFVTAMMALFIVLWLMNSNQQVRTAVGGYFKDPIGRGKRVGTNMDGTGRDLTVYKDDMSGLKERLKSMIKLVPHFDQMKGNIELTITEEGLRIELLESARGMFFESGRPEPTALGKELLKALATELGRIPNRLLIEGHSDSTPYSGIEYSNWELSADRANQARRWMEQSGLAANQVEQVRGFADQDLHNKLLPQDPANRRVSVIVRYLDTKKALKVPTSQSAVRATP